MDKVRDFKFGVQIRLIARRRPISQKCKSRSKGRGLRHVTYFYNFGTP